VIDLSRGAGRLRGFDPHHPHDLKRRIAKLAASSGQTRHAFMIDALARDEVVLGGGQSVRRIRIPTRAQPLYFARTQGSRPKLCP
jgi:hypothetical protein